MKEDQENYTADRPVQEQDDDKFQRYGFSKRIAETILNRQTKDSIVLGLYGAWGEGKTSVLNFIRGELSKHYPNIIQFTFNPWRFTDEAALLTSFFNTLASEIKKSLPKPLEVKEKNVVQRQISKWKEKWNEKKGPLKTSKETLGEIIQEYGNAVSIFGAGETAEAIGKAISNVDIEKLKSRIETLLEEHKKRIVIFLDDIDRLDKDEIHSIFRLVKLTADFSYTTYLLSFDNEMVASAIGERFGKGDKQAGENFLEKIIQVPLTLPLAQKAALKSYCLTHVDKALNTNQIGLTEEQASRFVREFTENILIRLTTPRLAVRYGNALSFSLPLLKGEVNLIDLMLLEAIRVSYPSHYDFVKHNPDYFIKSYSNNYAGTTDNSKKDKFKNELEKIGKALSEEEKESIKSLLIELFPMLNSVFHNYHYTNDHYNTWLKEKRLCSPQYFNRYLSYTVIEGDISDIAFENVLQNVVELPTNESIPKLEALIKEANPDNFLIKVRAIEKDIPWESTLKIASALSKLGHLFPKKQSFFFSFDSPQSQAAIFIVQMIKNNDDKNERFELIKELLANAEPYDFAFEIFRWCRNDKEEIDEKRFLTKEQFLEGFKILKDRALKEAGTEPIFDKYPDHASYLCGAWSSDISRDEFNEYLKGFIEKDAKMALNFLRAMTPTMISSARPQPYKADLNKERYDWIKGVTDVHYIYDKVISEFGEELISDTIVYTEDRFGEKEGQTDENILKQFVYWYNKEKKENEEKSTGANKG